MSTGFIPKLEEQKFKREKNGKMVALTRSKMTQLKDNYDEGKIDTDRLGKNIMRSFKLNDNTYNDKF